MSYAIANIYYGTYLEEDTEAWGFEILPESEDDEGNGYEPYTLGEGIVDQEGDLASSEHPLVRLIGEEFEQLYTDSGPRVFVLGQEVGRFDETEGNYAMDALIDRLHRMRGQLTISQTHHTLKVYSQLPERLRDALPPVGFHVIWSRS